MENNKAQQVCALISTDTHIRQWLESQPDGAIVGTSRKFCECPLSKFLLSKGFSVRVGTEFDLSRFWFEDNPEEDYKLPDFATEYADTVDEESYKHERSGELYSDDCIPVTKEMALALLDKTNEYLSQRLQEENDANQ